MRMIKQRTVESSGKFTLFTTFTNFTDITVTL